MKKKSPKKQTPDNPSPKKQQKAMPPPDDPLGRFHGTEDRNDVGNLSEEEQARRRAKAVEEARKMPPAKD